MAHSSYPRPGPDPDRDIFRAVAPESLAALRDPWIQLWVRASNAQGAIDFAGPVGPGPVEPLVDAELRSAGAGLSTIGVIVSPGDVPVAFAVLRFSLSPVQQHWAHLGRIMVDPARQRQGIGRRIVEGMQELARQRSLTQLRLTARSGLGLETFYAGLGYEVIGRHPGAVQIGPDSFRDEIIMLKTL